MKPSAVSVILPCFNSAAYLEETLASVLGQTHKNLEIVCIDDGSTDGTMAILRSFEPRIRVVTHPRRANRGQSASENLGIRLSASPFVAFVDSDDLWYPDKIQRQLDALAAHPDAGLVYVNGDVIDEKGRKLFDLLPAGWTERNNPNALLVNNYIRTPSSVMVRRSLLNAVGVFDERLQSLDHDLWLRMIETTSFRFIPEHLMAYRKHGAQQSLKRRQWEEGFEILRRACRRYGYRPGARRRRLAVIRYRLGENDLRNKKYMTAITNYMLSGLHDPSRAVNYLLGRGR